MTGDNNIVVLTNIQKQRTATEKLHICSYRGEIVINNHWFKNINAVCKMIVML